MYTVIGIFTLAASSGKHNVMVWRPSVRLSVRSVGIHTMTHQGQHETLPASVHFGPTIRRTDVVVLLSSFTPGYHRSPTKLNRVPPGWARWQHCSFAPYRWYHERHQSTTGCSFWYYLAEFEKQTETEQLSSHGINLCRYLPRGCRSAVINSCAPSFWTQLPTATVSFFYNPHYFDECTTPYLSKARRQRKSWNIYSAYFKISSKIHPHNFWQWC